jgi:hypothetical protein
MLARHTESCREALRGPCSHDIIPQLPCIAINPHNPAVQLKTFYRTCSALDVFLRASFKGLSTSDRILTSYAIDCFYQK